MRLPPHRLVYRRRLQARSYQVRHRIEITLRARHPRPYPNARLLVGARVRDETSLCASNDAPAITRL
jgi:hypothetical protein